MRFPQPRPKQFTVRCRTDQESSFLLPTSLSWLLCLLEYKYSKIQSQRKIPLLFLEELQKVSPLIAATMLTRDERRDDPSIPWKSHVRAFIHSNRSGAGLDFSRARKKCIGAFSFLQKSLRLMRYEITAVGMLQETQKDSDGQEVKRFFRYRLQQWIGRTRLHPGLYGHRVEWERAHMYTTGW